MELIGMRRRMTMILEGMMVLITLVAVVDNYSPDIVELLNTESNRWKGWIKNSGRYDGWRSQNIPPNGQLVYGLCSMQSDSRDNWLRSPFIQKEEAVSISVEITFTMRSCKARPEQRNHCEDSLYLMAYEADNPSDIPSSWNDRIYTTVAVVSPDIKWTDMTEENIMNIKTYSIEPGRAGFFIALRDNGACAMVKLVRVYYVACATITRSFADYPRTVVSNDYRIRDVKGVCVPGAELIDTKKVPYMLCQPSGEWHLLNTIFCRCQAGYTPSENNMYCIKCPYNTYKLKSGSAKCKFCPKYSSSGIGASNCTCDQGFVPVLLSPEKLSCIEHLKNPQNLKANLTEFGQVYLEWDKFPSLDDSKRSDGSNKYYYKVFCVSCKEWEKLHFTPGAVVTHTSVLIDALESDKMYKFSVMVANSLNQDIMGLFSNTSYSFASITTKPAEKSYQIRDFVVSKIESKHSILVSWSPTPGIEVDNYQIVIHGLSISPGNPKPIILDPILENIKVTQHKFPYLKKPVFAYRIKVRIRSKGFWGPFSNEKEINLNNGSKINIIQNDFEESKKDLWNPTKVLIVSIFGCGLALVATAIPLCFYFRYIISRSIRKGKKKIVKKPLSTTFDVANYSQIYTGSSNTKVYIDPSNYEDPSTIVQEFALEIDPDNVKIECVIGEGEFGEVCKGRLIKHESRRRITVAVKTLKSDFSEKERMNFLMEAGIMGQFNHPNIIRLEGVVTKTQPVMIITQFMEHGSLDAFLKKNVNKFSTLQLLGMLKGIVSGMRYLSEMHYVHRDLAARNILIDQNLCCKVSDFGLSREIEADNTEGAYTTKGGLIPIRWTAPEAINYRRFTSSSDVWSFGIVMWEVMSYGERPYWNWANKDVLQSIEAGYRLPAPKNCPPSIHLLMLDCWTYERSQRPKFSQIFHSIDALLRYPESLYSLPLSFSVSRLSISGSYKNSYPFIPKPKHKHHRSKSLLTQELVFSPESTVSQWLECLELPCYKDNFSNHNLIYLFQISKFTRNHLISLHISEEEHLQKLMCNIEAMQNYFETTQTTSFSLL